MTLPLEMGMFQWQCRSTTHDTFVWMHALTQDANPWLEVGFQVFVNVLDLLQEK
jgi:hypothetical protein